MATDSQAHFEFVWPPPRKDADGNSWNSKTATQYPCGGFTSASTIRTPFPLSGSVPIQLRLANWTSPDSPRLVYLNVKLNLGSNAGVGEYTSTSATSSTAGTNSTARNDPNAPATQASGKANPDFEFGVGLRYVQETFFMGGEVCLQDIWAPGWQGHTNVADLPQVVEGSNGTINIEVAETGVKGSDVVRRGYMCADVTFTENPLTHHQYVRNCHNDSIVVNTDYTSPDSSDSSTFFPNPLLPISPPPMLPPHHPLFGPHSTSGSGGGGYMGGPWSWHSSEPSSEVASRVGAAIGGSIAAVFVFLIFFGFWRRRVVRRQREREQMEEERAYHYDPEPYLMPVGGLVEREERERPRTPNPPAPAYVKDVKGLRGGEGDWEDVGKVEEGLPSYAEASGKGREIGREKI